MIKNTLGRTGFSVSKICMGTLTIGPLQANFSTKEAVGILSYAWDRGINFFDSAELYRTHDMIGALPNYIRHDAVIVTKSYAHTAQAMQESVENALKQMKLDVIPIFLLHEQESSMTMKGHRQALDTLLSYKNKGLIKVVGVSTHTIEVTSLVRRMPEIEVLFSMFNLEGWGIKDGTQKEMEQELEFAYKVGKGVYLMKVLAGGRLLGRAKEAIKYAWVNALGKPYPIDEPTIYKSEKACKYPSLDIDSKNNPHIAWTESEYLGFSRIQYARWDGQKWANYKGTLFSSRGFEVSHPSNSSYTPSLVLDKKDCPHIAFVSHSKGNIGICYVKLENKKWVNSHGKPYPKNSAFIAEREYLNYRHYYQNPWLDLRDNGLPNVVWEGAGFEDTNTIYYLCLENSKWRNCQGEEYPCSADISRDCVNSNLPIIRICPKGKPNVVWMGYKTGNLTSVCFIRWDGSCWVNAYGQPYPINSSSIGE